MRFLVILFFVCGSLLAAGQDSTWQLSDTTQFTITTDESVPVAPDSADIEKRSFNNLKLKDLRSSDDFDYRQPPSVAESLWDRFILWLDAVMSWMFRSAVRTDWGQVILYTIGFVVLIVIVMMLLKVDALKVFISRADQGKLNHQPFHENIHEMDFEKLINEALEKREYRLGVRLTFLYALKMLSDNHYVDWRPGKTNHDYLLELKEGEVKTGFNELSFYFDYSWYGEFSVTENHYHRVQSIFEDWKRTMR